MPHNKHYKIKITQIRSSNHRPVNHPDFKGDISDSFVLEDSADTLSWIATYIAQGDKVVLERTYDY